MDDIDKLYEKVIGCSFKVHNTLGSGFLEKVYENALAFELSNSGLVVLQQFPIPVHYEGIQIGDYYADLFIDEKVIVEINAIDKLHVNHEAQLVHYLTATKVDNGLLINFGQKVDVKRKFRVYKPKV